MLISDRMDLAQSQVIVTIPQSGSKPFRDATWGES
jgi:hypothetical protein